MTAELAVGMLTVIVSEAEDGVKPVKAGIASVRGGDFVGSRGQLAPVHGERSTPGASFWNMKPVRQQRSENSGFLQLCSVCRCSLGSTVRADVSMRLSCRSTES